MVDEVYFDPELGGNGLKITNDDNPSTGLWNGGHIIRMVPMFAQMMAVCRFVFDKMSSVTLSASQAVSDAQAQVTLAAGQVDLATKQVSNATSQASIATQQVKLATDQANNSAASAQQAKSYLDNLITTAQQGIDAELTVVLKQLDGTATNSKQAIQNLVNQAIEQVALDVSVAVQRANDAENAATQAQNYAQALVATSVSSITISTGMVSIETQKGKQFALGQNVKISVDVNNWLFGTVASYSGTTLTVLVTATSGIGTYTNWVIVLSGIQGVQGDSGLSAQSLALIF